MYVLEELEIINGKKRLPLNISRLDSCIVPTVDLHFTFSSEGLIVQNARESDDMVATVATRARVLFMLIEFYCLGILNILFID